MPAAATSHPPFPVRDRAARPAAPDTYDLEPLGELGPGEPLVPVALDDAGRVVAYGQPPERHAKAWTVRGGVWQAGRWTEMGTVVRGLPVTAVGAGGLAVGHRRAGASPLQAWASHRGAFGAEFWPEAESSAVAVNAVGEVAGHVAVTVDGRSRRRVFLHAGGAPRFLPVPAGTSAFAAGLNEAGTVLANCVHGLFDLRSQALLWSGDAVTVLRAEPGGGLWGTALTPAGRVCGRLLTPAGSFHAFLFEDGRVYDLHLGGAWQSEALAANDACVVVGRCMGDDGRREAFRWTPADGLRPLAALVRGAEDWVLQKAVAVNAAGWIAGVGRRDGATRGFLLRPVGA